MPDMRVGRAVGDRLISRVTSGLKLVPGEQIAGLVRLHGKKPPADCVVITNARLMSVASGREPLSWVRRQVLADEIGTWRLSRKFRSRLTVTSGYRRLHLFGSSFTTADDDLVDDALTALVARSGELGNTAVIRALRAQAHWVSGLHGRSVYVLDRSRVSPETANVIDLDIVEHQLSQFEHWPGSEVRRHLAACLPAGGCFLALNQYEDTPPDPADVKRAEEVADAVVTVDAAKLRRTSSREAAVLEQLMSVVAHIRANPAWQSAQLDADDLRVDINAEIRDIALRCHRVAELRAEAGEPLQLDSATGVRAAEVHSASVASLDAVTQRLDERVAALASYRDRLRGLARELSDRDVAMRIDAVAEKVSVLAAATVGEDETTESLSGLIPKAREGDDAIPSAISALREDVSHLRGNPIESATLSRRTAAKEQAPATG